MESLLDYFVPRCIVWRESSIIVVESSFNLLREAEAVASLVVPLRLSSQAGLLLDARLLFLRALFLHHRLLSERKLEGRLRMS